MTSTKLRLVRGPDTPELTNAFWEDMRADDRMVIDRCSWKVAAFPNDSGEVVIAAMELGHPSVIVLEPLRIPLLIERLQRAAIQGALIDRELDAEHQAHVALEKAAAK